MHHGMVLLFSPIVLFLIVSFTPPSTSRIVIPPPQTEIRKVRRDYGSNYQFECTVDHPDQLKLTAWYKNDVLLPPSIQERRENKNLSWRKPELVLHLRNMVFKDEGIYTCKYNGDKTLIGFTLNVTIEDDFDEEELMSDYGDIESLEQSHEVINETRAPRMVEEKMKESNFLFLPSGRSIRMPCVYEGNPKPKTYWYRNGVPIEKWERSIDPPPSVEETYLLLEDLVEDDEGNYTCFAKNKFGSQSVMYHLKVEPFDAAAPYIDEGILKDTYANPGENVTFRCRIETKHSLSNHWAREINGTFVPIKGTIQAEYLYLVNVQLQDAGVYACNASNDYGVRVRKFSLFVREDIEPVIQRIHDSHFYQKIIIITTMCIIFLFIIIFLIYKVIQYRRKRVTIIKAENSFIIRKRVFLEHTQDGKSLAPIVRIECETVPLNDVPPEETRKVTSNEYQLPHDPDWEVERDRLEFGDVLGQGAFGIVYLATARGPLPKLPGRGEEDRTPVAVKMLKKGHTDHELKDLISEMEVMKKVGGHPNIINLLGCVTQEG